MVDKFYIKKNSWFLAKRIVLFYLKNILPLYAKMNIAF